MGCRSGLKGIAHLQSLHSLVLEVAAPFASLTQGGHSSGWGPGVMHGLIGEVGTNAISAFSPPMDLNWGMVSVVAAGRGGRGSRLNMHPGTSAARTANDFLLLCF
jgi:hypothetical protein